MSAVTVRRRRPAGFRRRAARLRWALSDVQVLAWRTLARIVTTPEQLLNVTVQPLVFVLLFSYVFNGAIVLPGNGGYRELPHRGRCRGEHGGHRPGGGHRPRR